MFRVITAEPYKIEPSSVMIGNRTGMVTRMIATGGMKHPKQEQQVHDHEHHPPVHLKIGYELRQLLGNVRKLNTWPSTAEKRRSSGSSCSSASSPELCPRGFSRSPSDKGGDEDNGQEGAHARGLAGGGDPEVQDAQYASYQDGEGDPWSTRRTGASRSSLLSADDLRGLATLSRAAGLLLETPAPPAR